MTHYDEHRKQSVKIVPITDIQHRAFIVAERLAREYRATHPRRAYLSTPQALHLLRHYGWCCAVTGIPYREQSLHIVERDGCLMPVAPDALRERATWYPFTTVLRGGHRLAEAVQGVLQ